MRARCSSPSRKPTQRSSTATRTPRPGTRGSRRVITAPKVQEVKEKSDEAVTDVRESVSPDEHKVPIVLRDPYHQPHLQNFFNAVRGKAKLNCPAEIAYESAVSVLRVNEAIEAQAESRRRRGRSW